MINIGVGGAVFVQFYLSLLLYFISFRRSTILLFLAIVGLISCTSDSSSDD